MIIQFKMIYFLLNGPNHPFGKRRNTARLVPSPSAVNQTDFEGKNSREEHLCSN